MEEVMKKLKVLSLGLVGAMSLSLVACGNSTESTETTEPTSTVVETESETEYVDVDQIETDTSVNIDEVETVPYIGYLMGMEEMDSTAYTGNIYYFDVLKSGIESTSAEEETTTEASTEDETTTEVSTEEASTEEVETTETSTEETSTEDAATEVVEVDTVSAETAEDSTEEASTEEDTIVEDGTSIDIAEPEEDGVGYRGKMVLFVMEGAEDGIVPEVGKYYRLDVSPYMTMSIPPQAELVHIYEANEADVEYFNSMKAELSTYEDCLEVYMNGAMTVEEILYDAVSQCGYWTDEQVEAFREWFTGEYATYDEDMFSQVRTSVEEIESIREALEAESIAIAESEAATASEVSTEDSTETSTEEATTEETEASTEETIDEAVETAAESEEE